MQTLKPSERQRCEVWTRVMGYHRPTTSFNKGKQSEHQLSAIIQHEINQATFGWLFYA